MSIDTQPLIQALLWAGIEDYCELYATVWEVNSLIPHVPARERAMLTRTLVTTLLDSDDLRLVWVRGAAITPIASSEVRATINNPSYWEIPEIDADRICIATTPKGEERYRMLFI